MKDHRNPIHKSGERNLFCAFYSDCLGHAAMRHWKHWSCSNCPSKLISQPSAYGPITTDESILHYDLPQEIFQKYV
ncbi:MAG: hypothetical protein V3S89_06255 [Desulfobacterales bacterium]